eukprot:scaffold5003_cov102-Isochrysis_galbana.AAC.4
MLGRINENDVRYARNSVQRLPTLTPITLTFVRRLMRGGAGGRGVDAIASSRVHKYIAPRSTKALLRPLAAVYQLAASPAYSTIVLAIIICAVAPPKQQGGGNESVRNYTLPLPDYLFNDKNAKVRLTINNRHSLRFFLSHSTIKTPRARGG